MSTTGNPWCVALDARIRDRLARLRDRVGATQGHDVARRHVAHEHLAEVVGRVLGAEARAAARQLLRHDRVPVEQQRDEIRRGAPGEQRQQSERLTRRLECEDDRGEQRVRRAGEDRRHAHEPRDVRVDAEPRRERGALLADPRAEPAPIVNSGASVPPDVPLPRYTAHEMSLSATSTSSARSDDRARDACR